MKEFAFTLQKELWQGLKRYKHHPRNVGGLLDCQNCKASPEALAPTETLVKAFTKTQLNSYGIAVDWPFPQVLRGESVTLLAEAGAVWLVDVVGYALTQIATVPALPQDVWHFVDLGSAWFMVNGQTIVYSVDRDNLPGMTWPERVIVNEHHPISSACYFKGRVLMGGFGGEAWSVWSGLPENAVWWSSIGGGDVFLGWMPHEGVTPSAEELRALYEQNTMGYSIMPSQGRVICLKPLGDVVIVYTTGGVFALIPYDQPIPTFGLKVLAGVGVPCRGAVGGDNNRHIFVDQVGCLWSIGGQMQLERLDYSYFLNPVEFPPPIMVSLDPFYDDYYICNGYKGFVFNRNGMGKTEYLPTSIVQVESGSTEAIVIDSLTTPTGLFSLKTGILDMGFDGIKFVQAVEVACSGLTSVQVQLESRMTNSSSFRSSAWTKANNEGIAYVTGCGCEFKVGVKGTIGAGMEVDRISVKWKMVDKRSVRGLVTNAGSPVSIAD